MTDPHSADERPEEVSASVTFMEMMRQAASRAAATQAVAVDVQIAPSEPVQAPATPLSEADLRRRAAQMEAERVRRVQRRQRRRREQRVSMLGGMIRSFIIVAAAAVLIATIFTWFTPAQFLAADVRQELSLAGVPATPVAAALVPTVQPTPNWLRRIGIVSGHRGPELDPGAVCPDGWTEAEVNFNVATEVVKMLRGRGYSVDLLDEFDPRLDNYQAAALVSIHANTCQNYGEVVSGYLVAAAAARITARGPDDVLVECVAYQYEKITGLERHPGVTVDMTDYHTFREIDPLTPAAILELGFMYSDRPLLEQPVLLAQGIVEGVLCFLEPEAGGGLPADTQES